VVTTHLTLPGDGDLQTDAATDHGVRVPSLVQLSSARLAATLWGGLALVDLGRLAHAPSYVDLGLVAAMVAAASLRMRAGTALAAALVGWLLVDGFVTHRYGELGYAGPADLARLALLVGVGILATRVRR
jgi:hypothetical protein